MTCHQTKRGEGGKLERGRHRHRVECREPRRSVETKRRLPVEKGLGRAVTRSQRRQERACQDDVGGDHGDTRAQGHARAKKQASCGCLLPRRSGRHKDKRAIIQTSTPGLTFMRRTGRADDWVGCKASKAIARGCNVPQRVVFHLKPQLLHLAQTPVERILTGQQQPSQETTTLISI